MFKNVLMFSCDVMSKEYFIEIVVTIVFYWYVNYKVYGRKRMCINRCEIMIDKVNWSLGITVDLLRFFF